MVSQLLCELLFAAIVSIPVACISWTITNEEIFADFRRWLCRVSDNSSSWCVKKLCYLPTCPYCTSHWVTLPFLVMLQFKMLTGLNVLPHAWFGYIVSEFTIVLIANVYVTIYNLLRVVLRWMRAVADAAEANPAVVELRARRAAEAKNEQPKENG